MADNKDKTTSGSVPRPAHPQATWPITPAPMTADFSQWPQQMYWGQWQAAAMAFHPAYQQMYMQQAAPAVHTNSAGPSPKSKADSVKVVKPKDSFARSIHSPAGIQSPKPNSPGFLLGASKGAGGRAFSVYTSRADTPGGSIITASGGGTVDAANAGVDLTKASSKKTSSKSKPPTPITASAADKDKRDDRPVGVAVARQRSAADAKTPSDAAEVVNVSSSAAAATSSVVTTGTSSSHAAAPTTVTSQWPPFNSITPFMANPYQHFAIAPQPPMYMVPAHRPLFTAQPGLPAPPGYLPVATQQMVMRDLTVETSQAQVKAHASTSPNKPLSAASSPKSPLDKAREKLNEIQRKGGTSRQPSPSNSETRSISSESTERTTATTDTHGETKPYHKSVIIANINSQPLSSPEQVYLNPPPTKKERRDEQSQGKGKGALVKSDTCPFTELSTGPAGALAKSSTAEKAPRPKARRSAAMSPSDADAAIAALETLPADPMPLIAPAKFKPTLSRQPSADESTDSTKFVQPAPDVNLSAGLEKSKVRRSRSKDSVESPVIRTQPARRSSATSGRASPVAPKPTQLLPYTSPARLRNMKSPTSTTRESPVIKEVKAVNSRSAATKSRQVGSRAQKRKSTDSVKAEQIGPQSLPIPVDVTDKVYIWAENAFDPIIVKHNQQAYDICEEEDLIQLESKLKLRLKAVNKQLQTHENYLKGDSSSAFPLLLQSLSATDSRDGRMSPEKVKSNFSVRSDSHPSLKMKAAAKAKSRASQDEKKDIEAPPPPDVKPQPTSPPAASVAKRSKEVKTPMAPLTPIAIPDQQLRCRRLNKEELSSIDSLILTCIEGLFYESRIKAISPPDLYGVSIDGERHSSKPRIFTQEELVANTFTNRTPTELSQIDIGSRVCAYWSDMISCLYPGKVTDIYPAKNSNAKHLIDIEFDDGDSGKFPLYQMRILPQDLPHIEYDTSNVIPVGRRRRSALPDTPPIMTTPPNRSRLPRSSIAHSPSQPQVSPVPKKKSKAGTVTTAVEPELFDQSTDDEQLDSPEPPTVGSGWKWVGPSTRKPTRGRGVRFEYKSATKDGQTISVGNFVEVCPNKKSETPYIGEIQSMWGKVNGEMNVTVKWFYHPEDLDVKDVCLPKHKGALFRTEHSDTILIESVKRKCDVLSHEVYVKKKLHVRTAGEKKNNDIYFFIAGIYNPASKQLTARYYQ